MSFMFDYPIILTLPNGKTINCKEVPVPNTSYCKLVNSDDSVAVMRSRYKWSTKYSSSAAKTQLVFDSKLVQAVMSHEFNTNKQSVYAKCMEYISRFPWTEKKFYEFISEKTDWVWTEVPDTDNVPCFNAFSCLQVIFIPKNTMFRIKEYDGVECIEKFNSSDYMVT